MADQDDFEPGGRCWKKTRQAYLQHASADHIAFLTEHVLKKMLRVYGESNVLPQLLAAFADLAESATATATTRSLWEASVERQRGKPFEATLSRLELLVSDRRIDAVMLRTARCLVEGGATVITPEAFITHALCDVARHCCLDEARASSIGPLFSGDLTGRLQAHAYHQDVLATLAPGAQFLARQYLRDPSAQTLRCRPHRRSRDELYTQRLA